MEVAGELFACVFVCVHVNNTTGGGADSVRDSADTEDPAGMAADMSDLDEVRAAVSEARRTSIVDARAAHGLVPTITSVEM